MIGRWTAMRIGLCGLTFAVLAVLIARRAYDLQVVQGEKLRSWAEDNYLKEIEIAPSRGRIFDRNGKELASTTDFDWIFCNPRQLASIPEAPRKLAKALDLDYRELKKTLAAKRHFAFAWLKRRATPEHTDAVKALGLPGVQVRKVPGRVYPFGELASTVIGHAGVEGRGLEGVELAYDRYLAGTSSQVQGIRDALGRQLFVDGLADPTATAGKDVWLSIDKFITYTTEQALAAAVHKHSAKSAVAVVMDPRNGEILALSSVPSYNPNDPGEAVARGATKNRAVVDEFEPGSIMKAFTFAAALEAGQLRPTDWFECMNGRMPIGNFVIRDTHSYGSLTAADVFKHSSNICTVKIARRIGKEALWAALERFGFGKKTGVGLEGEARGRLRPVEKAGEIGFANVAFGQGLTVTALQIATGYAAIASGGVYHAPRIGMRVVHPDGQAEAMPPGAAARPDERVISETTARTLLGIMRGVTEKGGTGTAAAIDGYPVAGKTGTAQKVVGKTYHDDYWVASFIGVVPADKPRLVVAVIVDEPRPMHLGGAVAAPVFKEIAEATLRYLSIPPSEAVVASSRKKEAPAAPAKTDTTEGPGSDLPAIVESEPEVDDEAGEAANADESEAGQIGTLAAEDREAAPDGEASGNSVKEEVVTVPSFRGMSIGQAIHAARRAGVELALEGSGVAVSQSPKPGPLRRGSICRVSFRPGG